jgi:hypothetical protein
MKWALVLFLSIWILPVTLSASLAPKTSASHDKVWKQFNDAADDKTLEIKAIVFGPVMKVLGMLGIAYGVAMLAMGQTRPLITFGGIGLLINIIPYFVDAVFSALVPGM